MSQGPNSLYDVYLPVARRTDLAGAIFYLAYLAYPKPPEVKKRDLAISAMQSHCAKRFWHEGKGHSEWRKPHEELTSFKNQPIRNRLSALQRIINKRLAASYIATSALEPEHKIEAREVIEHITSVFPEFPLRELYGEDLRTPSITAAIGDGLEYLRGAIQHHKDAKSPDHPDFDPETEKANNLGRIWAPSKPVLHLAIAFHDALLNRIGESAVRGIICYELPSLLQMLHDSEWVVDCLHEAEDLRTRVIPESSALRLRADQMISLRLGCARCEGCTGDCPDVPAMVREPRHSTTARGIRFAGGAKC